MTIWEIPKDKIINYSKTGDDIDLFTQKVKYCLEEAFVSLKFLHNNMTTLGGVSYAFDGLADGQTLVYDASTQTFVNDTPVDPKLTQTLNELQTLVLNVTPVTNDNAQKILHLQRLVENLYLALDVAGLNPYGYDNLHVATFCGDLSCIDTMRSSFTLGDGKISAANAILVTNPIYFTDAPVSKAHLVVKHTNIADAQISAQIALYDVLDGENFLPMTKTRTYPDKENPNRATTEFTYSGEAGNVATLSITADGADCWLDSFACTFDE